MMYPGAHARHSPDKPAVVMAGSGERLTYSELDHRSAALARYLYDQGLRRGDHIAMLVGNEPTAFEVYWAAMRSGLYITAVNWHLSDGEVTYIVNDCGARALVVSAGLGDMAERIAPETGAVHVRIAYGGEIPGHVPYRAALGEGAHAPMLAQPCGADMLYSSGTTGRPKGVKPELPDRQVDEPGDVYAEVFGSLYGFDACTVYLSPAPVYHAAPLRFAAVVHALGGTVVVMERFDPEGALAAIEEHRVTHSQWVPTMFVRMLKLDERARGRHDLSSHTTAIHAAAPCPVEVKRAMIEWWGPILQEYYSSTEGNGMTFIRCEDWLRKPGSVGQAGVGTLRICDDDGAELPPGDIGTVYFERDRLPFAYHNDPDKTAAAQHPRHPTWSTTGDIGYIDDDGFLFLTDRKAFMIISGGVNIYPQEVEDCLVLHPKVADAAVIGIPDEEMGESVRAVIEPQQGVEGSDGLAEELTAFLRERIAHYKVPRSYAFTEQLPRTPTGKLLKASLRESHA